MSKRNTGSPLVVLISVALVACSSKSAQKSGGWPPAGTQGLELCVSFDGLSGTSVPDGSGQGRSGKLTGNATPTADGRLGAAVQLAGGEDDEVDFGDILHLTNQITVQAWVRPSELKGRDTVVCNWDAHLGYWLGFGPGGRGFEWFVDASRVTTDVELTLGSWHHLAGTFDSGSGELVLFVDGKPVAFDATHGKTPMRPSGATLTLGNRGGQREWYNPLSGVIDEVQIWSLVRTPAQICADAGGKDAIGGDCTAATVVNPALNPLAEPLRPIIDKVARAAQGIPVDFDGDGVAEYTQSQATDGTRWAYVDFEGDGTIEYSLQRNPDNSVVISVDQDSDGNPDGEETWTAANPYTRVVLRDTDFDGFMDERTTFTYDYTKDTLHRVVETDPTGSDNWQVVSTTDETISRSASCSGSAPDCLSLAPGCGFPNSDDVDLKLHIKIAVDLPGSPTPGGCDLPRAQQVIAAIACALTDGLKCLSDTNREMAASLDAAINGEMYSDLDIACHNGCQRAADTSRQPKTLGQSIFDSKLDLNPAEWDLMTPEEQCSLMLHELLHWAGYDGGPEHNNTDLSKNKMDDDVHSCGRYCGKCQGMGQAGALREGGMQADCATCSQTPAQKRKCGTKQEREGTSCPDSVMLCVGTIMDLNPCADCQSWRELYCDGTAAEELTGGSFAPCCNSCPPSQSNSYPCDQNPHGNSTCGQKPPYCP